MKDVYLGSWTPAISPYPPYISINYREEKIELVVRNMSGRGEFMGVTVAVRLSKEEFTSLIKEVTMNMEHLTKEDQK